VVTLLMGRASVQYRLCFDGQKPPDGLCANAVAIVATGSWTIYRCYVTEGYSCKALAVAALGLKTYGGGGRTVLGCVVPPEQTVVIVPAGRRCSPARPHGPGSMPGSV
jgi:hypothetical protein